MSDLRRTFEHARRRMGRAFSAGDDVRDVLSEHADAADAVLVSLFENALQGASSDGVALVALGGYGRRELAPHSDLDLLVLHRGWTEDDIGELNRRLLYPLWDAGCDVGNRVRDLREVVRMLDRIEEAAAVLDSRLLAGDRGLFLDLDSTAVRRLERRRASFLRDLSTAASERHDKFGHAGHLLEPDVRDAAGGLRDVHMLRWASRLTAGGDGLEALEASGYVSAFDRRQLREAETFLLRARTVLHLHAGRKQDVLLLSDQDEVATALGYPDTPGVPGDAFMRDLYRHARSVDQIASEAWERLSIRGARRPWGRGRRTIGDGCVVQNGRIEIVAVTPPATDPVAWLRAFGHAVRTDHPIGRGSLNRLQHSLAGGPVPWSPEARAAFGDLLSTGWDAVPVLEAMDATGFMAALIEGWEPVRCLPQRNLYHRYTVDMHLFATVAELAASRSLEDKSLRDAWTRVGDVEPLYWAALLHDVGKGRGGDHSSIGADIARRAAQRAGFPQAAVDDVDFLVRDHLLLAELATRRDLNDERTVADVIARVADERRLAMLFLLTRADALATGPEAWSTFRASLVRELYARTLDALTDEAAPRTADFEAVARAMGVDEPTVRGLAEGMPESWAVYTESGRAARVLDALREPLGPGEVRTSVHSEGGIDELLLVTQDRPGLMAAAAGVLALRGVDVHSADVYTRSDGIAVDVFRTSGTHGPVPHERWDRVERDLRAVLDGSLDLDEALRRKGAHVRRTSSRRASGSRVHVDNDAADGDTVIEIHTRDRFGLLRRLADMLARAGCDIRRAKVATYGVEVVDVFYVRDAEGRPITDPEALRSLSDAIVRMLDG